MSEEATERLTIAAVVGVLIGGMYGFYVHNPLAVAGGVGISVAIEVAHLALQARRRRQFRPVVRDPRISHVVPINPRDRRRTA